MTQVADGECREQLAASLDKSNKKPTLNFYKAVYIYVLGGFAGTLWETFLNLFCGYGFKYCNGSIFTPVNFVYGFGGIVIVTALRGQTKWRKVYITGAIGGGAVEYLLNFLEETLLGTRSWNYSALPLNINGRTTLPYMAGWGLLCVAVIFAVYRPLNKWIDKLPEKTVKTIAVTLAVILIADLTVTVSVILRYALRHNGVEALTFVGEFIDSVFNDSFMKLRFPNTKF